VKKSIIFWIAIFVLLLPWREYGRIPTILYSNAIQRQIGTPVQAKADPSFGKMPLIFVENQGQLDPQVAFTLESSQRIFYFTESGVTYVLNQLNHATASDPSIQPGSHWVLKLDFIGARAVKPQGLKADETVISYFKGQTENWLSAIPTYTSILYPDLWPGIDLVYSATNNHLKSQFTIHPGSDPAQIRLAYRAANGLSLNEAGQLEITTPFGSLQDDHPLAYQEIDGQPVAVKADYALQPAETIRSETDLASPRVYTFQTGPYDSRYPLQIDPAIQAYAGFIGGSAEDHGQAIALDSSGAAYIAGYTNSTQATFPSQVGLNVSDNGGFDAFVAKVKPDGSGLVYISYIGGSDDDYSYAIAVEPNGAAYLTGYTRSTEVTFPVKGGPDLTFNGGLYDAFVVKIKPDGKELVYAGYIGGNDSDCANGIAVDANGAVYITGGTSSNQNTFPVHDGPDLTFNGGVGDAFVAKVEPDGSDLEYAGYIGGANEESGNSIVVNSSGAAYVTGYTDSNQLSFPVRGGPDLTYSYDTDGFIAKICPDGTQLVYAGYIGGAGWDQANGIALDGSGAAYVTGYTQSDATTFPLRNGPDLTYHGGYDTFIVKIKADGSDFIYAGYVGGLNWEEGDSIVVDSLGAAYITGQTYSTETTFPVRGGPDLSYNGGAYDVFFAKIKPDGSGLIYVSYLGGKDEDIGRGIALGGGAIYIAGTTLSDQTSFPVQGGPDLIYNGSTYGDAFVIKITITEVIRKQYMPILRH
jgi:hypothetical protein